jgi:hypothetical protein
MYLVGMNVDIRKKETPDKVNGNWSTKFMSTVKLKAMYVKVNTEYKSNASAPNSFFFLT